MFSLWCSYDKFFSLVAEVQWMRGYGMEEKLFLSAIFTFEG
jgi:hypothetical protein